MDTTKIPINIYWNESKRDGEGSASPSLRVRMIAAERRTEFATFLEVVHRISGFEKAKFHIDLIGRHPSLVHQSLGNYVYLPIVDDSSLHSLLDVPIHHPCIGNVDIYLALKPVSIETRKRARQEDEKQLLFSSSWLHESELHAGMLFRDVEELDSAVKLYSARRQRDHFADRDLAKGTFISRCKRFCGWSLKAAKTKSHGFEITEYRGPHNCKLGGVGSDFLAGEIQGLIKADPSLSPEENNWLKQVFGYTISLTDMHDAKTKAITAILGDVDTSFSLLPKFMAALCSSNNMLVDWQYDIFPDPKDASFRSVFWAFQQSVEGFPHCRPVIIVDTVALHGKYAGELLVAAGCDADDRIFPLAFAIITQENLSADSWRWFFACIRKNVTQREDLCVITCLD